MENLSPTDIMWIVIIFIALCLIWFSLGFLGPLTFADYFKQNNILFSDGFNAVNALFSGLAFMAIVITLIVQQREIDKTKRLMHLQQFESSFFQMLSDLKTKVEELQTEIPIMHDDGIVVTKVKGISSFDAYDQLIITTEGTTRYRTFDELNGEYYMNAEIVKSFDTYYITLALLLNYIENSGLSDTDKVDYFNLVIKPMAFKQKVALFYHIGINTGRANEFDNTLREIEKKYRLLEDLWRLDRIAPTFDHRFLIDAGIHPERGTHPKPSKSK